MKITIPKGSLVVMPKKNTPVNTFRVLRDIIIDRKDISECWEDIKHYEEELRNIDKTSDISRIVVDYSKIGGK